MIDAPLALALASGLVAAVNPCGFAMLPAYVTFFLGVEGDRVPSRGESVVRAVPVPEHVQDHAVRLVVGTQPGSAHASELVNENVLLGSSPRGAQGLLLAGKVSALLDGRFAVSSDDINGAARDVLRHRVMINFQGQADGVTPDHVINSVIESVGTPSA